MTLDGLTVHADKVHTMINRIQQYVDSKGREIHELTEVTDNILTLGKVTYHARVTGNVNTPMGPQAIPLTIPIDNVTSIAEAYAQFDAQVPAKAQEAMAQAVNQLKAEMRRAQLAQGVR